jgi:hypothetical protein
MNEAIIYIWVKIVAIILMWEAWKFIGWELINWWMDRNDRGK